MITIIGLTPKGVKLATNPRNPAGGDWRVIHFLKNNNNQATKDTVCSYCFGGDMASCNMSIKRLKQAHIVAEDIGSEVQI